MTDEEMVLHLPPGQRFEMLFAAYLKYLLKLGRGPREKLETLEMLDFLGSSHLTPETIKAIEPMPDVGIEIMDTAFQLDRNRDGMKGGCPESYRVLTKCNVFEKLLAINPSLMNAISIYTGR
jgi:hypothetical protein